MKRTSYVNEGCKLAIYVKGGFNAIFGKLDTMNTKKHLWIKRCNRTLLQGSK